HSTRHRKYPFLAWRETRSARAQNRNNDQTDAEPRLLRAHSSVADTWSICCSRLDGRPRFKTETKSNSPFRAAHFSWKCGAERSFWRCNRVGRRRRRFSTRHRQRSAPPRALTKAWALLFARHTFKLPSLSIRRKSLPQYVSFL